MSRMPHILAVDDNQDALMLIQVVLEKHNYRVTVTTNGHDIIARHDLDENIDLIISDFQMPEINGLDLFIQLRGQGVSVPFVLVTGFSDVSEEEMIEAGMSGFIGKPYTEQGLIDVVQRCLSTKPS